MVKHEKWVYKSRWTLDFTIINNFFCKQNFLLGIIFALRFVVTCAYILTQTDCFCVKKHIFIYRPYDKTLLITPKQATWTCFTVQISFPSNAAGCSEKSIPSVCVIKIAIQPVIHEYIAWLWDNEYFRAFLFPFPFICIFNKSLPFLFFWLTVFFSCERDMSPERILGNRLCKKL
jgi:hypothetical protein